MKRIRSLIILFCLIFTGCSVIDHNVSEQLSSDDYDSIVLSDPASTAVSEDPELYDEELSITADDEIINTTPEPFDDIDSELLQEIITDFVPTTEFDYLASTFPDVNFDAEYWDEVAPFTSVNYNIPFFTDDEKMLCDSFENYSPLDDLGRCQTAFDCIGIDIMPTEERGRIGMIKPSGWQTSKYDKSIIEDMYLFNRCHLIAYCLSGENSNELNLITGTRFLNISGMLYYEDMVYNYMQNNTKNHVLYRVTPIYKGNDLLAQGVLMEGWSVEDKGTGICFCSYCYNVQPNIIIDYSNGDNQLRSDYTSTENNNSDQESDDSDIEYTYVLNTRSKRIHRPNCKGVKDISDKNRENTNKDLEELKKEGYKPCGMCHPENK